MNGFAYRNRARAHKSGKRGSGPIDDVKTALATVWGKVPSPLKKLLPFIAAAGASALAAKLLPSVIDVSMIPKMFRSVAGMLLPGPSEDIEENWAMVEHPPARSRFKIVRKGDGLLGVINE